MDQDKTRASYIDSTNDEPLTLSRQFRLSRALTDEEIGMIYRYVPADEVDFYQQLCWRPSPRSMVNVVRFDYWYNLPFHTQTLLELILPCR